MSYTKITSEDLVNKGVTGLADTPGLSTTEMQEKFDELSKDVIVPKFNNLVDELDASNIDKKVESETITNVRLNEDNNIEVSIDGGTTYKQTSSSGHIIMDGTGRSFPQRSRLQYSANTIITDVAGDNTTFIQVPSGVKGDKGDSATITVGNVETSDTPYVSNVGSQYDAIFDFGIPKGEDGSAATIQVGTVTSGDTASVSNRGTSSSAILDFVLPKGEKGDSGTSFQVLGTFATYEELIATHPVGNRGDAYAVGDATSNVVYNWNNDTQTWDNLGALKGVKGDDGTSATITIGTVTTSTTPTVENVGTSLNAILNFGLQKGDKGDTGNSATIAVGKVTGGDVATVTNVGTTTNAVFDFTIPKGDKGDTGEPSIVNGKSGESIVLYGYDLYLKNYAKANKYETITDDDNLQSAISKLDAKSGGGAKIIISTDEESIGHTFTCAKGDVLLSDIADSSLQVTFDIPDVGTWTVINVEAGNSLEVEVPYFGVYRRTLGVGDVNIVIAYTEEYIGYDFSITNGTKTKTKTATGDLSVSFVVAEHETWTVSNTLNDTTKTVNATEGGTYNVEFGVAPAYNYQGWLDSAEITKSFVSLDEVLADELTVRELMTKHASADYLYDWYEADTTILDTIVTSTNAMKWLGLRDYAADKFCSNANAKATMLASDNWEYILKDHIPTMTSNTMPYGEVIGQAAYEGATYYAFNNTDTQYWLTRTLTPSTTYIAYKFDKPTIINRVSVKNLSTSGGNLQWTVKTYYLKGSNDGSTWNTIGSLASISSEDGLSINTNVFENTTPYFYYGIFPESNINGSNQYVGVTQVQFYGRELRSLIPTMTSDTTPYGEAFTDSYRSTNPPFMAFDGSDATYWAATSNTKTSYVAYEFPHEVLVRGIYTSTSDPGKNYTIRVMGKNVRADEWNELYTYSNTDNATEAFNNDTKYKIIGIEFSTSTSTANGSVTLYGVDYYAQTNRHYLYDNGLEIEELYINTPSGTSVERRSNCIYCNDSSTSGAPDIESANKIALDSYTNMHIEIADDFTISFADMCVNSSYGAGDGAKLRLTPPIKSGDLDISSANGSFYVGGFWSANANRGNFSFKEWYLE